MKTDQVAAITMVYGDSFLEKWIAHHASLFGMGNLFVVSHGQHCSHDKICSDLNHITIPRNFDETFERARIDMINRMANGLLSAYHAVVFLDVDEFLVLDPSVDQDILSYIQGLNTAVCAPVGLHVLPQEVGQQIDWTQPILSQTRSVKYDPLFCKPCVRTQYARQGVGGHALFDKPFTVDPNMLLLHLKYTDLESASRYDGVAQEVAATKEHIRGVGHWVDARRRLANFVKRHGTDGPIMTPDEGTKDFRSVVPFADGKRFRVDTSHDVPTFKLPTSYKGLL